MKIKDLINTVEYETEGSIKLYTEVVEYGLKHLGVSVQNCPIINIRYVTSDRVQGEFLEMSHKIEILRGNEAPLIDCLEVILHELTHVKQFQEGWAMILEERWSGQTVAFWKRRDNEQEIKTYMSTFHAYWGSPHEVHARKMAAYLIKRWKRSKKSLTYKNQYVRI